MITYTFVPGAPKTKGSLTGRPSGKLLSLINALFRVRTVEQAKAIAMQMKEVNVYGSMVESTSGSARWRALVARAVEMDRARRGQTVPAEGPVSVRLIFILPVANVTAVRSGDLDKLVRNVLDALTDAKAYVDDVQVVRLLVDKVGAGIGSATPPGVIIHAWSTEASEDRGLSAEVRGLTFRLAREAA